MLVVLAGFYAWNFYKVKELNQQAAETEMLLESAQAQLIQVTAAHAELPKDLQLEQKVGQLELQLKGEEAVLAVLNSGQLGNTEGYSAYMRAFARQIVGGLWLTNFSIQGAGMNMQIGGRTMRAENVPLYIRHLNQEPSTRGRVFTALEMRAPKADASTQTGVTSGTPSPAKVPAYLEFRLHSGVEEVK